MYETLPSLSPPIILSPYLSLSLSLSSLLPVCFSHTFTVVHTKLDVTSLAPSQELRFKCYETTNLAKRRYAIALSHSSHTSCTNMLYIHTHIYKCTKKMQLQQVTHVCKVTLTRLTRSYSRMLGRTKVLPGPKNLLKDQEVCWCRCTARGY